MPRYTGLFDESHWEGYPGQICPSQVINSSDAQVHRAV
jgi:hypothetical protein